MCKKKKKAKVNLDDEALFVSSEDIKRIETAIENLEQVQKGLEKAAKGKPSGKQQEDTTPKS